MNRRDLLKWFGAGAVAVPIIGGMPKPEAAAVIVHAPVIEVPPPPKIHTGAAVNELAEAFMNLEVCEVSVYIRRKDRPYSVRINCDGYLKQFSIGQHRDIIDITSMGDQRRRFLPLLTTTEIVATGEPELIEGGMA